MPSLRASLCVNPSDAPSETSVVLLSAARSESAPLTRAFPDTAELVPPDTRFRDLVSALRTYAIFSIDPTGVVLTWNPGVYVLLGYTESEFVGAHFANLICPEERSLAGAQLDQALRSEHFCYEGFYVRKDGTRLWMASTIAAVRDASGILTGFCQVLRDNTEAHLSQDAIRSIREGSERQVVERTVELSKVIDLLEHQLIERERLEAALLEAAEAERNRLGQDLHDSVCQQLVGVAMLARLLATRLTRHYATEAAQANKIVDLLRDATDQARGLAQGLHPVSLETNQGIVAGLQELTGRVHSGVRCRLRAPARIDLPDTLALHFYRIAQESLRNAIKHANAHEILIDLRPQAHELILSITDDGRGLPAETQASQHGKNGMGLLNLQFRARAIGAQLTIESAPGQGTTVRCRIPFEGPSLLSVPRDNPADPQLALSLF